ncbi:very long-chain acyl-CoA synthetase-like isoform X2 [Colossoma macropomum]|uniref:very long-chain acyl-CoA synthetase-like isoform X2 n=1 Tax=Colossoma macropomum TaxID=42526 RepID=UPI0018647C7F|nr:very long-chain acyl-CoA synthetase-like isoform X2 [Colossoma macropomum]
MSVLYSVMAGLAVLLLLLRRWFPYLLHDFIYLLKGVRVACRLRRFGGSVPCYTVLDCFLDAVQKQPEKKFIIFEGQSYSYRDADKISNKVAQALLRQGGLREGDTVALFLGNEPLLVWIWLGVSKLGCTVSFLNHNIRSKSLLHCFSCCGAKALIAGADLHAAVEEVLPMLKEQQVMVLLLAEHCDTDGIVCFSEKINVASDEQPPISLRSKVTMKSPALYIYTSGTTGFPKAAVINHERVWMASHLQFMSGVSSNDIIYICLPLYHSSGFLMGLTGAIERGITVMLKRKFSASKFWDDCRNHNVTVIQYIGETMRYLCKTPKTDRDRVHSVRLAFGNGIRGDTWMELLQRFGNMRVSECYGATEGNIGFVNYVGKIGATGRVNMFLKRVLSYALIKYDTEKEEPVRNSRGFCEEVPTGETGLLVAKITKVAPFSGYANNQQQTDRKKLRNVFVEGDLYFNSGDLLKADGQGFLYFQDRIGDTFRWKGENVATSEVTDVLISVDFIEEANVYGVKVPGHEGRIGMAAVKLKEGRIFDGSALFEQVQSLLPAYARPRFIRIQSRPFHSIL